MSKYRFSPIDFSSFPESAESCPQEFLKKPNPFQVLFLFGKLRCPENLGRLRLFVLTKK
jgi:hypothetical protein